MGLDILRERLRLGEERLAIDRIAASLGFECACNARRADQRCRAAQRQNETEFSHDQSPGSRDQLNQVYKLGPSMPSREVAKSTRRSPLVFRMRQTVFLMWRDTAIIDTPQTTEEFDAIRRPFRRRGSITPRLKRSPVADLARVAHGDVLGSAALMAAGVLLAAAVWYCPWRYSRLFGNLVSRLQS